MRLEGQSKLGYYPTPENSLNLILTWLRISNDEGLRRYLDPCCGKGEALAAIAAAHGPAETFGIELSDVRANDAEHALDYVLNTAYEYAVLTDETFSLVLLNPPYDGENSTGGGRRMEETFLLDSTPRLASGGVLIYIIPHQRINEKVARHLAGWYDDLRCFKLAGDDYEAFGQVVIFGTRRQAYAPANANDLHTVHAWADAKMIVGYEQIEIEEAHQAGEQPRKKTIRQPQHDDLPELITGRGEYIIPTSPLKSKRGAFRFQYVPVTDEGYLHAADDAVVRLEASSDWRDLIPLIEPPTIEPAMTPKKGHIAMQVNGGLLGTNLVRASDQTPLLIKGNVRKTSVTSKHDPLDDDIASVVSTNDGDDRKQRLSKIEVKQRFETALSTLDAQGKLVMTSDLQEIKALLDRYVEQLAEIVQARNVPQYDMKPESWEWAAFDHLSKGRQLPGRDETGLTEFQKHLAIALGRLCLKHGAGVITAEMASGKAQPLHAKVLTPHGWRTMGDIRIGDLVIGADGKPTRVVGVFPQGEKDIYRVTFDDGVQVECCEDHLWTVQTPLNKWKGKAPQTLSLRDIMTRGLRHANGNLQLFVPLVKPVQFAPRELPIDPYVLGVLLGDGSLSSGGVGLTSADSEILYNVSYALPDDVFLKQVDTYDWRVTTGCRGGPSDQPKNSVLIALRDLGLMGHRADTKFIPYDYLFGSIGQRISLLQGLLDTDGYVTPNSATLEFVTVSPQLAEDVTVLVQSLGGTVTRRIKPAPTYTHHEEKRVGQVAYRLFLALGDGLPPFRLTRKLARYRRNPKYPPRRAITAIDHSGRMAAQCLKVEAADGLYVTDHYVVTHNTTIGLSITEYLRYALTRNGGHRSPYPGLIAGPGVVTGAENWPKEIAEVIPGATNKVITIGAKPLPKAMKVGLWLRSLFVSNEQLQTEEQHRQRQFELKIANDAFRDEEFEGLDPEAFLQKLRQVVKSIRDKSIKQRVTERIKQAITPLRNTLQVAWHHLPRRRPKAKAPNLLDARLGGYLWLGLDVPRDPDNARDLAGKYSIQQFIEEYRCGALPEKSFAVVSYETAKLGSGRVPAMTTRHLRVKYLDDRERVRTRLERVCTCPTCGAVVAEEYDENDGHPLEPLRPDQAEEWIGLRRRYCQAPQFRRVWDEEKGKHIELSIDDNGERYVCGAPLFEVSELRRLPAASLVKHAKKFFGLLLVDEIHKAKAKGTGVGWALTVLNNGCRFTVGLTGTLFGGYSTSIFWLMHRLSGEVRREFGYSEERRWVEKYGLLKTTFYVENPKDVAEDGAYTGTKEFLSVSEMPGISPAIAGVGLKYCTFSSLKDIGLPLPDYAEEIVRLEMTEAMKTQMQEADGYADNAGLFAWALNRTKEEDGKGAISVWLNTALNRPDAVFRGEQVVFHPRVSGRGRFAVRRIESVLTLPPVVAADEWLPKEKWAAHQCLIERDMGRKTLVYVRQTGERDVQPRIAQALEAAGLRVGILRPSVAPARRAPWIKAHAREYDVLLTNARLVEVGLNLTMFNTAIFFEIEWSLYTLWQSMRRLYRPGAILPVKLFFPVYQGTQEENALDLLGHKMLAAQTFYGDEVGGALVDELDDGDLLTDLVRKALGKLNVGRAEGIFSIGNKPVVTPSPMGSPTVISPTLKTFAELAAAREQLMSRPRKLPVRKVTGADKQLTLL